KVHERKSFRPFGSFVPLKVGISTSSPLKLAVIHKLKFRRSAITLGKVGKLVEQHRMDQIENIDKYF
ncbi:MAG: hypothetical protein RMI90_11875, partial [Thermoguttaceae bacterium]|nr:hypothetical protein [Thermoguttaceae bacterium]